MSDTFDISGLAVKDTGTVELVKPNGDPMMVPDPTDPEKKRKAQAAITVFGPGSKEFQRAQAKRNRSVVATVKRGANKMKDDDQREIDATFLADCTASFDNFNYAGMEGYDQFKALYMNAKMGFVAEQVNSAIGNWANFSPEAEPT